MTHLRPVSLANKYFVYILNVLERNQNQKTKGIKDALVSRENQNTLINITEI